MRRARSEDGAVLLTTLLVMSLMAALAVAIIEDMRAAVKRSINIQAYSQADWYLRGAEDFAQSYLSQLSAAISPEELGRALAAEEPIIFPIEGGAISVMPRDGSQCFSLGALQSSAGYLVFRGLLESLNIDPARAGQLAAAALDWQDSDKQVSPNGAEDYSYLGLTPAYRTANTAFASVTELRALEPMTESLYQELRPFLCARPAGQNMAININTLTPAQTPLLAAALGGAEALPVAAQLIAERPPEGYRDKGQVQALPVMADFSTNDAQWDYIVYTPQFIWIEAVVIYFEAERKGAYEFSYKDGNIELIYRRLGEQAFRPRLKSNVE